MSANLPAVVMRTARVMYSPEMMHSLLMFSFQWNATIANGTLEKEAVH